MREKMQRKIPVLMRDMPCSRLKCDFWDVQGHYCFLDMEESDVECIMANEIEALIPDKDTIIREEQKRNSGALRVLFEKGLTLNDLIQAEDTMEEEYTNIVEQAKREAKQEIYRDLISIMKNSPDLRSLEREMSVAIESLKEE